MSAVSPRLSHPTPVQYALAGGKGVPIQSMFALVANDAAKVGRPRLQLQPSCAETNERCSMKRVEK